MNRRRLLYHLGTSSAFALAAPHVLIPPVLADGGMIYQRIWDADQTQRGIPAIRNDERGDEAIGFVRVDEQRPQGSDHRVIAEVSIPEEKRSTYDLFKTLLDNYRLDQTKPEETTIPEANETIAFLEAITDSAPMEMAKAFIDEREGGTMSRDSWQERIFNIWFRQYDYGRNLDLSGFEHIAVGEQKSGTVGGYHFWYRYYLDDFGLLNNGDDIDFEGLRYKNATQESGPTVPDVITLAFRWRASDPAGGDERPLFKPVGGFWVGCSIEGLMALGMARFHDPSRNEVVINKARYDIDLYRSPDGSSLRSFFPIFKGLT